MRLIALLILAPLLLSACGNDEPAAAPRTPATSQPSTSTPSESESSPTLTGPLAGFPLNLGYPERNGDDGSPVEITTKPATHRFSACGRVVWDPMRGTTDRIGVKYSGEAEYYRGRTLVLYRSAAAAGAAVAVTRSALAACTDEPDGHHQGTTHTLLGEPTPAEPALWTDTFYTVVNGKKQYDTGLVVYQLVHVGRAVLLVYEYGEGNGSASTRSHAIDVTVLESAILAKHLRELDAAS
jgi:hypothetical protein